MRFYVICIGKLKDAYLRDGVAEFVKRMRPYGGITITELNESKIESIITRDDVFRGENTANSNYKTTGTQKGTAKRLLHNAGCFG